MAGLGPALFDLVRARADRPGWILGLSGAQGSGKSTLAAKLASILEAEGRSCAVLSLDDLYLGPAARADLARRVHPLFAVRGPPGTHDPALGLSVLDALSRPGPVHLPRFDKGRDAPVPDVDQPVFPGPADIVIFEGWCLGARPDPSAATSAPINALEREHDADGTWRGAVEGALAGPYQDLFAAPDLTVFLRAPDFETVRRWRGEQEAELARALADGRPGRSMGAAELEAFLARYERITRRLIADPPGDFVVDLAPDRTPGPLQRR
ncbi:kinase [Phenylobacterium sp.]|uniref:kinase n=1 Tax=Phenylobacterium sp. TaxID=1871053 RepID=UPI0025CF9DE1|nr:kinase [Phenylobacterium sp.]MCA3723479.1 kinase [Phenylobacterium sp.]